MPQEATHPPGARVSVGVGSRKDIMNQYEKKHAAVLSRRDFDESYQRHAVDLSLRGDRTAKTVAQELEINIWTLYRWRKQYARVPAGGGVATALRLEDKDEEIWRLCAEVVRLQEREIVLKKSFVVKVSPFDFFN